jgi:branched-chain amino acid transport system permease protein
VAAGLGINLVSTKLMAFATGAGLAGISGALFATKVGSIFPASFGLLISINVLVLIILGGMGSIPGVFIGALVLVALPELLREFSDYRLLLYGAVLVVMMLTRPQGLWPAASARHEFGRSEDGRT